MGRRTWLLGISAMLIISGCVDSGSDPQDAATSSAPTTSSAPANTTASVENTTNEPPVPTMEADNVTGAIPLNVTFLLNGTDPEGGNLSWTLSFGDDSENLTGESLPANATHSYALQGNFTAFFEVSDGVNVANISVAVNVTGAASEGPTTHVITGSTLIPFPAANELACINDDIDGNIYDLAPAGPGWTYTLEPSDGSFGIYWYAGGSYDSTGEPAGVVPEGMDQVEICNVSALPMSDYTLTLTAP